MRVVVVSIFCSALERGSTIKTSRMEFKKVRIVQRLKWLPD
jgi:hypothetical protein